MTPSLIIKQMGLEIAQVLAVSVVVVGSMRVVVVVEVEVI